MDISEDLEESVLDVESVSEALVLEVLEALVSEVLEDLAVSVLGVESVSEDLEALVLEVSEVLVFMEVSGSEDLVSVEDLEESESSVKSE